MERTHGSASDYQLNLSSVSTHHLRKFVADTLQGAKPIVFRHSVKEVLQDITSANGMLLQLGNDGLLVIRRQRRGGKYGGQFGVPLEDL
jgi:hypothetical protein